MKVFYWGQAVPGLFELLTQTLRGYPELRAQVGLQIPPQVKTAEIAGIQPDEILRADINELETLGTTWFRRQEHEPILVLDAWGILVQREFDLFLKSLEKAAWKNNGMTIVFLPQLPSFDWNSLTYAERHQTSAFSVLFQRTKRLYEAFLNGKSEVRALCSSTPISLLGSLCGSSQLSPVRRMGLSLLPWGVREVESRFVENRTLVAEVLRLLQEKGQGGASSWLYAVPSGYQSHVAEEKPTKLFEKMSEANCSWAKYVSWNGGVSGPMRLLMDGADIGGDDFASWCFLQGHLAALSEEGGEPSPHSFFMEPRLQKEAPAISPS